MFVVVEVPSVVAVVFVVVEVLVMVVVLVTLVVVIVCVVVVTLVEVVVSVVVVTLVVVIEDVLVVVLVVFVLVDVAFSGSRVEVVLVVVVGTSAFITARPMIDNGPIATDAMPGMLCSPAMIFAETDGEAVSLSKAVAVNAMLGGRTSASTTTEPDESVT